MGSGSGLPLWAANLLSPPILFFVLGVGAAAIRSDLAIPKSFGKVMSLYLLFSLGFKGGGMLRESGLTGAGLVALAAAVGLSAVTPLWVFPLLRRRLGVATAAGVAAAYGSVSAVTFIAASSMLRELGVEFGGHMVAAMVLMEFPALIVGVAIARLMGTGGGGEAEGGAGGGGAGGGARGLRPALREAVTNGSVVLLVGSMVIGAVTTEQGRLLTAPLWSELFLGLLCFYLLDLGLAAGRGFADVRRAGGWVMAFGVCFPAVNAGVGLVLSWVLGMGLGDGFLMMVMAASASYIAAPAALRIALPEAKESVYVPMALTLTFPFNIVVGLPVYWWAAQRVLGTA